MLPLVSGLERKETCIQGIVLRERAGQTYERIAVFRTTASIVIQTREDRADDFPLHMVDIVEPFEQLMTLLPRQRITLV